MPFLPYDPPVSWSIIWDGIKEKFTHARRNAQIVENVSNELTKKLIVLAAIGAGAVYLAMKGQK